MATHSVSMGCTVATGLWRASLAPIKLFLSNRMWKGAVLITATWQVGSLSTWTMAGPPMMNPVLGLWRVATFVASGFQNPWNLVEIAAVDYAGSRN